MPVHTHEQTRSSILASTREREREGGKGGREGGERREGREGENVELHAYVCTYIVHVRAYVYLYMSACAQ